TASCVNSQIFHKDRLQASVASPPGEKLITIFPVTTPTPASTPTVAAKPRFARTSPDQSADRPEKSTLIGERDTRATSDRTPDASAPPMPSQKGEKPKDPDDLETTESDYKDGKIAENGPSPTSASRPSTSQAPPADPSLAESSTAGEKSQTPGNDDAKSSPPSRERLLEGPNPVDVPVPINAPRIDTIKPTPPKLPKEGEKSVQTSETQKPKSQQAPRDPAFSGFQRKTAITGSISRNGRSALAVADSALGRYQAIISRAVEQEWQRNCVRHRDFITPGFLTVRFFVETSGRVRSVKFMGEMETGEVQKGFTLNSIRDAEIPAMPQALKKEYDKEPLELIFNFYF
ncbi:MAG: hypothetical protein ABI600_10995, partial [Luteolibacter sp.]